MNFIAGIALLVMPTEEDAFWLLTSIVEEHNSGKYASTMVTLQVDTLVLDDLLSEKLPELKEHMNKYNIDTIIVATKWFMCLFIGHLPTETLFRLWDKLFLYGPQVIFRAAFHILSIAKDNLLQAKDPSKFSHYF